MTGSATGDAAVPGTTGVGSSDGAALVVVAVVDGTAEGFVEMVSGISSASTTARSGAGVGIAESGSSFSETLN